MKKRIITALIFIVLFTGCETEKINSTAKSAYNDALYELGIKELTPAVYISWYEIPRAAGPIIICSKDVTKSELRHVCKSNLWRPAYGERYIISEMDLIGLQSSIDRIYKSRSKLDDSTYSFSVTTVNKGLIKRFEFSASDILPVWANLVSFSKDKYLDLHTLSLAFENSINNHKTFINASSQTPGK